MSEKRFRIGLDDVYFNCIEDFVFDTEVDCMIDNAEVVELLNEQQATIRKLQDLCGESDSENAKLRIKNKEQQATIKDLERKLQICSAHLLSDECCLTDGQIRKIIKEMEQK